MSLVKVTNTIIIDYVSTAAKPAGGFRLYYNPTIGGNTLSHASPSIPIGYTGAQPGIIVDDPDAFTLTVQLPYLLPLIEITAGAPSRQFYIGVAPVDANGNIGDIETPVALTVAAPTFVGGYSTSE